MNKSKVVVAARIYLNRVGFDKVELSICDDDFILSKVNMLYFGGLQAFVRKKEREDFGPPLLSNVTSI